MVLALDQEITDPWSGLQKWFEQAQSLRSPQLPNPNAGVLSTIGLDGFPDARVLLLKSFSKQQGLVIYTNYTSTKSLQLEKQPHCSFTLFWDALALQIRVRGYAQKGERWLADNYFATRPRLSQLGAWASKQSHSMVNREEFLARLHKAEEKFQGKSVPCPEFWGAWQITPNYFEFWRGQTGRLHERLVFTLNGEVWQPKLLYP